MLRHDGKSAKSCMETLKAVPFREAHFSKNLIFEHHGVYRFGVSDVSIIRKSKRVSLTVTCDERLFAEIVSLGGEATVFRSIM